MKAESKNRETGRLRDDAEVPVGDRGWQSRRVRGWRETTTRTTDNKDN